MRRRSVIALWLVALLAAWWSGAGIAAAQSGPGIGRDAALRWLTQTLADSGLTLTTRDVEGGLLGELRIGGFAIADADGRWLDGRDLRLRWQPWQLLRGRLQVTELSAATIDVARAPVLPPGDPAESGGGLPSLPLRLVLDRLAVTHLTLGEALLGRRLELSLDGQASAGRDAATVELDLRRRDAPGSASVRGGYDLAQDRLEVAVRIEEPAGGAVAGLLGLAERPALRVALDGEGPLSAWRGRLDAQLGGREWIAAEFAIDGQAPRRIAVDGRFGLVPALTDPVPAALRPVLGDTLTVAARARLAADRLHLDSADIAAAEAAVRVSGTYTWDSPEWDGRLELLRLAPAAAARFGIALERPTASLSAQGVGRDLTASLRLSAGQLAAAGVSIDGLASTLDIARVGAGAADLTLNAEGRVTALPADAAAPLLGVAALTARARLDDPGTMAVTLHNLALRLGEARLTADGSGTAERAAGRVALRVADLAAFAPATAPALRGAAQIAADVSYAADEGLALRDVALDLPPGRLTGAARSDADWQRIDGRLGGSLDLAPFAALVDIPLSGGIDVALRAAGSLADPQVTADLAAPQASLAGTALPPVSVRLDAARIVGAPNGHVRLTARLPEGPVRLQTPFVLSDDRIEMATLTLDGPGLAGRGHLALALGGGPTRGQFGLAGDDLAPLLGAFGYAGGGRARLQATLDGRADALHAELSGEIAQLELGRDGATLLEIGRADLSVAGGLAPRAPLSARLSGERLAAAGMRLERAKLAASGTTDRLAVETSLAAPDHADLRFDAAGTLRIADGGATLQLTRGRGRVADEPFTVQPGLTATFAPQSYRLGGLRLSGPGLGRVEADVAAENGALAGRLALRDLSLAPLGALAGHELTGHADLDGRLSGTVARPNGTLTLSVRELAPQGERRGAAAEATLVATVDGAAASARLDLAGLSATPLAAEVRVGRTRDGLGFDAASPLSGRVTWRGAIGDMLRFAPLVGQDVSGAVDADLTLGGSLGAPAVAGTATMTDVAFEDYRSGLALRAPSLEIVGDTRRIVLRPFEARGPAGGRLTGQALVDLDAAAGFPFDARIDLTELRLLDRDDIVAVLSGTVAATGAEGKASVTGTLASERAEIDIARGLPPSVVTIEVIEVGAPPGRVASPAEPPPADGPPALEVALDVRLDMPARVFVRGRGLDSEWSGNLAVAGTADAPRVSGRLQSRRGQFDLVGRIFQLQPSTIDVATRADGGTEAILDIRATHEGRDLTVTAAVTGPATEPTIELSSTPVMPQDEILSRLLFGKSRASLSALEALQLAQAVRTLAGGGLDPIAALRRAVGVDVLRVESGDAEAGPSLEAGKYVSERVYLGVRQGAAPGSGALAVEIELRDNVTVENETRQDGSNRVGLKYKYDY